MRKKTTFLYIKKLIFQCLMCLRPRLPWSEALRNRSRFALRWWLKSRPSWWCNKCTGIRIEWLWCSSIFWRAQSSALSPMEKLLSSCKWSKTTGAAWRLELFWMRLKSALRTSAQVSLNTSSIALSKRTLSRWGWDWRSAEWLWNRWAAVSKSRASLGLARHSSSTSMSLSSRGHLWTTPKETPDF